ncbi:MAG: hypothetical protein GY869_03490, partial [Planctomycetes bacterium]|nr:hypothetical protein [Planctomycetota bacterium]
MKLYKYCSILWTCLVLYSNPTEAVEVLFSYENPESKTVCLVGSFNAWNASTDCLLKNADGVWQKTVSLKPGRYEYKFIADDIWISDPKNPDRQPDGYEGFNSILIVESDSLQIDSISLVGNLTDWQPNNPENYLRKIEGEQWQKTLHLGPGEYHLKLAFNDGWTHSFGGNINQPLQPGADNIKLRISEPAAYRFIFDAATRFLAIEKTEPTEPIAVISGPNEWDVNLPLTLSGKQSRPLPASPFSQIEWSQNPDDPDQIPLTSEQKKGEDISFRPTAAGIYHFSLKLFDGEHQVERGHAIGVRPSVQLLSEISTRDVISRDGNMSACSLPNRFEWIFKADKTTTGAVRFALDHDQSLLFGDSQLGDTSFSDGLAGRAKPAPLNAPIPFPIEAGKFYKITFDQETKDYDLREVRINEFRYNPAKDDRLPQGLEVWQVDIVGSMNNWQGQKTPMQPTKDGIWYVYAELSEGLYPYKIRVNEEIWLEDANADSSLRRDDLTGQGTYNSVVLVGETGAQFGQPLADHINVEAIEHNPINIQYLNILSEVDAEITVRTLADDVMEV